MGCLFGCFRVKDTDRRQSHLISDAISSKTGEPLVSKNRLSSLLQSEERRSSCEDVKCGDVRSGQSDVEGDSHMNELKEEAKFLKSCGTLLETPAEIRKASERVKVLPHDGDDTSSKFHSWLPGNTCKKLQWEERPDPVPIICNEQGNTTVHQMSSPSEPRMGSFQSFLAKGKEEREENCCGSSKSSGFEYLETVTSGYPDAGSHCRKKSVRFECDTSGKPNTEIQLLRNTPYKNDTCGWEQSDSPCTDDPKIQQVGSRYSPYPTPLKLSDEMQTPGTVYPAKLENFAIGKNTRIRSQYVYPVLNPVENLTQWNALKDSNACQLGSSVETFDQTKDASMELPGFGKNQQSVSDSCEEPLNNCRLTVDVREQNQHTPIAVDASLSQWLKPSNQNHAIVSNGKFLPGKGSDGDRPILGIVAAHWSDDEPSRISPKGWDGNGIPNSTTKYKEDQKVSWHATPFEERLEKALSDERVFLPRDLNGKPIDFDESEEADTAASCIQSLARSETILIS